MLELNRRQQTMLKEMGIRLPWARLNAPATADAQPIAAKGQTAAPVTQAEAPISTEQAQAIRTQLAGLKKPSHAPQPAASTFEKSEQMAHDAASQPDLQARAAHLATLSLEALQEQAQQCQACELCHSRKQVVFSAGVSTAEWMIVGEAPGEQEDKKGEPFVGPAGQLLDLMLAQLNLSRNPNEQQQPVYISNVLKCRPPRNRNPNPKEIMLCEPFLKRQIELIQPKIILVVGRFAVQTLLQTTEAIGKLRGRVHHYEGIPAIVTYHPAYLLRNPIDKRKAWEDLCLAAQTLNQSKVTT